MVSTENVRAFKAHHRITERGSCLYFSPNPLDLFVVRFEGLNEIII